MGFSLERHREKNAEAHSEAEKFPCKTCGEGFAAKYLKVHQNIHTEEQPFVCPTCHTKHLKTHSAEMLCTICGKSYKYMESLERHTSHLEEKLPFEVQPVE
jgi:hypothetical protein